MNMRGDDTFLSALRSALINTCTSQCVNCRTDRELFSTMEMLAKSRQITTKNILRSFLITFLILVLRKLYKATDSTRFVNRCWPQINAATLRDREEIKTLIRHLKISDNAQSNGIFFLNRHALPMTHNFLCNARDVDEELYRRFAFITLDDVAYETLNKLYPTLFVIHLKTEGCFEVRICLKISPKDP